MNCYCTFFFIRIKINQSSIFLTAPRTAPGPCSARQSPKWRAITTYQQIRRNDSERPRTKRIKSDPTLPTSHSQPQPLLHGSKGARGPEEERWNPMTLWSQKQASDSCRSDSFAKQLDYTTPIMKVAALLLALLAAPAQVIRHRLSSVL